MTFGEKLRRCRKQHKWTQSELAQRAHVSLNTISNYEKGATYPQDHKMYKVLADVLGVDVYYLQNEHDRTGISSKSSEDLIRDISALFAGGEISEEEKDGVMKAVSEVYWKCKADNAAKYSKKKN